MTGLRPAGIGGTLAGPMVTSHTSPHRLEMLRELAWLVLFLAVLVGAQAAWLWALWTGATTIGGVW